MHPGITAVFLGSSGVGKSSLVNALAGENIMETSAIREDDDRGRHTTTHRQLLLLPNGALVIDTPGMRALGMWDVSTGLGETFTDVDALIGQCRFRDCRHESEPGCAIQAAIENGTLSREPVSYTHLDVYKRQGLPDSVFNMGALKQDYEDANMLKGGLAYADRITTVSGTYAYEIQTAEYGENLEDHLRYHSGKLRGIVNGIDYGMWNPETDPALAVHYGLGNVLDHKMENKLALQKERGLHEDESKFGSGLISRLTNQKGLDLVSSIIPQVLDGNTQVVVLGTGDKQYEDTFRYYENTYRGTFSACIQYDEARAHRIYAGADALLVPSRFEPVSYTHLKNELILLLVSSPWNRGPFILIVYKIRSHCQIPAKGLPKRTRLSGVSLMKQIKLISLSKRHAVTEPSVWKLIV